MKTASMGKLEVALVGDVFTIARGERWITLPQRELPELIALLGRVGDLQPREAHAVAPPASPALAAGPAVVAGTKPAVDTARAPATAEVDATKQGGFWHTVQNALAERGEPQSIEALLTMVRARGLTSRNADLALRAVVGKKLSAGELIRTPAGNYGLPGMIDRVPAGGSAAPAAPPAPAKRKHRPGELWGHMKKYLVDFSDGLTLAELTAASEAGAWTGASSHEHAVKICLGRVGGQIERLPDGRYRLTGPVARQAGGSSSAEGPDQKLPGSAVPAEGGPEGGAPALEVSASRPILRKGPRFDASDHYPTPRSRQPR